MIPVCELYPSVAKVFWLFSFWSQLMLSHVVGLSPLVHFHFERVIDFFYSHSKPNFGRLRTQPYHTGPSKPRVSLLLSHHVRWWYINAWSIPSDPHKPQSQLLQGIRNWLCFWWNVPRMPLQCSSVAWHCWRISGSWTWAVSAVCLGWRTPHPDWDEGRCLQRWGMTPICGPSMGIMTMN